MKMNENNYHVSLDVAKLLKAAGWSRGTQGSYGLRAELKDPEKKWDRCPKLPMNRVDDVLYYCNAEEDDGTKTYPDLVEEDWIKWVYKYTGDFYVINTDDETDLFYEYYEAPMILDVIDWLREEHGKCIGFKPDPSKMGSYTWEITRYEKDENNTWRYLGLVTEIPKSPKSLTDCANEVITRCLHSVLNSKSQQDLFKA